MNRMPKHFATSFVLLTFALLAVAGCGSDGSDESPSDAVNAALVKTSEIKSGVAEVEGSVSLGNLPGAVSISGGGPFDTAAEGGPAFNIALALEIAGSPQKFGFASVDGDNYMIVGDKAAKQKNGEDQSLSPEGIASLIKSIGQHVTSVESSEDGAYTAKLDTQALLQDAREGEGKGLDGLELPGFGSADQLTDQLGVADITIKVSDAGYADEISLDMPLNAGGGEGALRLTVRLSEVDEPQKITAPTDLVSDPSKLGGGFGSR